MILSGGIFACKPYTRFTEFISPGADRFAVLCSVLEEAALPFTVRSISGKRHIVCASPQYTENGGCHSANAPRPPANSGGFSGGASPLGVSPAGADTAAPRLAESRAPLILTAHYDCVEGSAGANDNGAAVFMLVETAMKLQEHAACLRKSDAPPRNANAAAASSANIIFIFTDGEEVQSGGTLIDQGSYSLGLALKAQGLGNARVYSFDACGTGDTLVISTAADYLLRNESGAGSEAAKKRVQLLREAALAAAREARLEKVLLLPTPFSDDGGFLRAGITAQTITVLPQNEAAAFASYARAKADSAAALFSSEAARSADRQRIPETWRSLNGPADSPLRLTSEHWKSVTAFAAALYSA